MSFLCKNYSFCKYLKIIAINYAKLYIIIMDITPGINIWISTMKQFCVSTDIRTFHI